VTSLEIKFHTQNMRELHYNTMAPIRHVLIYVFTVRYTSR